MWCEDANKEVQTRTAITYPIPTRTESVSKDVTMNDGTITIEVRDWNPAIDAGPLAQKKVIQVRMTTNLIKNKMHY
jgi:hypothetical protein